MGIVCIDINVIPPFAVNISANGPFTICQGGNLTLDAGAGYSNYNWSNGSTTQTMVVTTPGIYQVTVTNPSGCTGVGSQIVNLIQFQNPSVTANGPVQFCSGGSVVLTTGVYGSYMWSNGATTQSTLVAVSGTYIVTVSNGGNCTGTAQKTVTVYATPVPNIIPSGPVAFCAGGSVNLTVGAPFSAYHWNTGATTQSITATIAGPYTVTVTNVNGCTGVSTMTVTVAANPTPSITYIGTAPCQGGSGVLNPGYWNAYLWSTGATTQTIPVSVAGYYYVTVTNAANCTGTAAIYVNVGPPPVPVITSSTGVFSMCSGSSITLNTGNYASYLWSTGATTQSLVVTAAGTYSVTVTNANGCTGVTQKMVTVLTSPAPVITATNTFCTTGNAALSVTLFASYNWSNAATTQSILVNTAGTYTITVSLSNGCTGSTSATVSNGCITPTNESTSAISFTTAMANWTQPSCYYGYTIRISKHNLNTWTSYTIAPNTHYTFSGLAHATSYDWQIRTNCDAAQTNVSPWCAIQTFTTLGPRDAGYSEEPMFKVFPNPTHDHATMLFYSSDETKFNVRLMDITGRIILNEDHEAMIGDNQYELNLETIAKGAYILVLQKGEHTQQAKIIVQ